MTNVLFDKAFIKQETTDAPLWPRFVAWSLDLAVEIAVPYLVAVTGYVAVQGLRNLVGQQPFNAVDSFSDALFPKSLWGALQQIDKTGSGPLDPNLLFGVLSTTLSEFIYILPATLVLWAVFFIMNRLMLPALTGKTLGKQLMGIKIVTLKGETPSFPALFLRHGPGQWASLFFFLGYVFALVSPERRTWHDYIAGTRVVEDETFTPLFQRDGTISSTLVHLEAFVLAIFLTYFLKLLVLWLRILGIAVPAFLLPEAPPPPNPIEFTLVDAPPSKITPPKQTKRFSSTNSVAGGKPKPKQPVAAGSPAPRKVEKVAPTPPKPVAVQPKPASTPKPIAKAAPQPAAPAKAPIPDNVVTTPDPSSVTVAPKRQTRTTTSENLGELASTQPTPPTPPTRQSRSSTALGGPLTLGTSKTGTGPGGRGNSPLFNPDRAGDGQDVDTSADVDFGPYMGKFQARVKRNWFPPEQNNSRRTVLTFDISRDGRITRLKVSRTSGNANADQAALDAIQRSQPFAPLPDSYRGNKITITFTFDLDVFNANYQERGF